MQALRDEDVHLNIDLMHLWAYDPDLYEQLVAYPGEVIPLLDQEAREIAEDLNGTALPDNQLLTVNAHVLIHYASHVHQSNHKGCLCCLL